MAKTSTQASSIENLAPRLAQEFQAGSSNGCVGQRLVSETERGRVWTIRLAPGERLPFHKHVKDYIWVAVTAGRARSSVTDGKSMWSDEFVLTAGDNAYNRYGEGSFKIHDLENIGETELLFVTIEFADSANPFLSLPHDVLRPETSSA